MKTKDILKHYIGTGLSVQVTHLETGLTEESGTTKILELDAEVYCDYMFNDTFSSLIPIFRTDLTQPITEGGRTFVPIEELFKDHISGGEVIREDYEIVVEDDRTLLRKKADGFYFEVNTYEFEYNEFYLIQKLISWKFKVHDLEDEYLVAEELDVNPYETKIGTE